jgi:excisionase family DNA binding protein
MPAKAPSLGIRDSAESLSTGQAARRLGVSEAWVRRLVISGRLPAIVTPLGRLIPATAVEDFGRRRSLTAEGTGKAEASA